MYNYDIVSVRLFTKADVDEIWSMTIKKVILSVTNIPENAIQDNPFFLNGLFPSIHLYLLENFQITHNKAIKIELDEKVTQQ